MKKLLISLVSIGCISAFSINCGVELQSHGINVKKYSFIKAIDKELNKKGYFVMDKGFDNTIYSLSFEPIEYHYEGSAPNYFLPVGVQASLYSKLDNKEISHATKEGLVIISRSEAKKFKKLSKRAVRQMLKSLSACK
jgi:hypothetical protein